MLTLTVCERSIEALKRACIAVRGENRVFMIFVAFQKLKVI